MQHNFWKYVEPMMDDRGCWEWSGSFNKAMRRGTKTWLPYGRTWFRKSGRITRITAHRFSWLLNFGDIPKGMCVLHRCDNSLCVNPKHLFLGTQRDNVLDMFAKGRAPRDFPRPALHKFAKDPCPKGHVGNFGNRKGFAKKRYCRTCSSEAWSRWIALHGGRVEANNLPRSRGCARKGA